MGRIEIISASAGSGKTYRLATAMEDAVAGAVRPEAVLATTFTIKAAEELRHRARTRLVGIGRPAQAQRLEAARIGTVHAVCNRLIHDFAFEQGCSPALGVLDPAAAETEIRRVQSQLLDEAAAGELAAIAGRMNQSSRDGFDSWSWQADVAEIIRIARDNGLDSEQLRESAARSRTEMEALLGPPAADGVALDQALLTAIESFVANVPANDTTKTTAAVVTTAQRAARRMQAGNGLPWSEWAKLSKLAPGKKSADAVAPLLAAASAHDRHPRLRGDLLDAIERVFDLAIGTLDTYQAYKDRLCVQDFTDQEVRAFALLERDEVRAALAEEVDLVLVDEFQDTSPIELAIFLRLAGIAPHSIWVGDQKQSIYAFRGTDPSLMDAAIASILGDDEPESLGKSYRSRPGLVDLTSEVFVPAFGEQAIPANRVRLEAANDDPTDLGPVMERWCLDASNKNDELVALAAATAELLCDPAVNVRDPVTLEPRGVRPSDVAILCRLNDTATGVARAVAEHGLAVVLQQPGLLETIEGRVMMSALQLWVDPRDALAAAELARLLEYPDRGDDWLERVAGNPGREAFADEASVLAILEAQASAAESGPVRALDTIIAAIDLPLLCARLGDEGTRLANVEAMRAHATVFVQRTQSSGAACTVAGFVQSMLRASAEGHDRQGVEAGAPAITVSTWHGAKGLEWPITVLYELQYTPPDLPVLGVSVASDRDVIDPDDPLAGRWIRYWPQPYGRARKDIEMFDRVATHPASTQADEAERREQVRLLYVGWTRARDRVVLADRSGRLSRKGPLTLLPEGPPADLDSPPAGAESIAVEWAGRRVSVRVRHAAVAPAPVTAPSVDATYPRGTSREHPPAYVAPSTIAARGAAGAPDRLGEHLNVTGTPDWRRLGNAIHGFFATDVPELDAGQRRAAAERLLEAWDVSASIAVDDVLVTADRLRGWIDARWPGVVWHREWPVCGRRPDGTIVRGEVDLVLDTEAGVVIIDHKSFPGSEARAIEQAAAYLGQVESYADIVARATGKDVLGMFVHMPLVGVIMPVVG